MRSYNGCVHKWRRHSSRDAVVCECGEIMDGKELEAGHPALLAELKKQFAREDAEYLELEKRGLA